MLFCLPCNEGLVRSLGLALLFFWNTPMNTDEFADQSKPYRNFLPIAVLGGLFAIVGLFVASRPGKSAHDDAWHKEQARIEKLPWGTPESVRKAREEQEHLLEKQKREQALRFFRELDRQLALNLQTQDFDYIYGQLSYLTPETLRRSLDNGFKNGHYMNVRHFNGREGSIVQEFPHLRGLPGIYIVSPNDNDTGVDRFEYWLKRHCTITEWK